MNTRTEIKTSQELTDAAEVNAKVHVETDLSINHVYVFVGELAGFTSYEVNGKRRDYIQIYGTAGIGQKKRIAEYELERMFEPGPLQEPRSTMYLV